MPKANQTMLNQQQWKMAAPGAGMVYYQPLPEPRSFRTWLSFRTSLVGKGYGVTNGGFADCKEIHEAPVGSIQQLVDHAYRESCEESHGFGEIITLKEFRRRANPTSQFLARVDDLNEVHAPALFGFLAKDEAEWHRIGALPAGVDVRGRKEREDALREVHVFWHPNIDLDEPERYVTMQDMSGRRIDDREFNYVHEFRGVASIAYNIENPRSWV